MLRCRRFFRPACVRMPERRGATRTIILIEQLLASAGNGVGHPGQGTPPKYYRRHGPRLDSVSANKGALLFVEQGCRKAKPEFPRGIPGERRHRLSGEPPGAELIPRAWPSARCTGIARDPVNFGVSRLNNPRPGMEFCIRCTGD